MTFLFCTRCGVYVGADDPGSASSRHAFHRPS